MKKFVITENEKKQITSLYKSKGFLKEFEEPEPVFDTKYGDYHMSFYFDEGQTKFNNKTKEYLINFLNEALESSMKTIQKYHNNPKFKLPQFITFEVGTSSTGSPERNRQIGQERMKYLTSIYTEVMNRKGVDAAVAEKLLSKSVKEYEPTKLDKNFYDPKKVKPNPQERVCHITIRPITEMGLDANKIGELGGKLIDASSFINNYLVDNVDEDMLTAGITSLQTYSDLKDIDKFLRDSRNGTLQDFLNQQLMDDPDHLRKISDHLNLISNRSNKGDIATIVPSSNLLEPLTVLEPYVKISILPFK